MMILMVIEASILKNLSLYDSTLQTKIGVIEDVVYDKDKLGLAGFQVRTGTVVKKYYYLPYEDVIGLNRDGVYVKSKTSLDKNLKPFDAFKKHVGPIIGVKARTENKKVLGKIRDLFLEAETGRIMRFHVVYYIKEQIIPRQFIVAVTPKVVVFKDVVSEPIFDSEAVAAEASPAV